MQEPKDTQEVKKTQEEIYSLETILSTITKVKNGVVKKKLIFDQGPVGGISAKWVILFLFSLPIMLYAGIFNPTMFEILGIAQAIIFFIVFLSMVMIIVVVTIFINNSKVSREINPTWKKIFEDIELKLALSTSASPYKDFFKYYGEALKNNLKDKELEESLKNSFKLMAEENKSLLDAMSRDRSKK